MRTTPLPWQPTPHNIRLYLRWRLQQGKPARSGNQLMALTANLAYQSLAGSHNLDRINKLAQQAWQEGSIDRQHLPAPELLLQAAQFAPPQEALKCIALALAGSTISYSGGIPTHELLSSTSRTWRNCDIRRYE